MMGSHIVTTLSAPNHGRWGGYKTVAVVRAADGQVVREWPSVHEGSSARCEFARAVEAAEALAAKLDGDCTQ